MSETVYVETSVVGYLTARLSNNLILMANLGITQKWWDTRREQFTLYISPPKASDDALHIAVATFYGIDYLLTWNCKHIANAQIQKKLAQISIEAGYDLPTICTPNELMGD
ncbi:MAG: type II toxin-antitoxin system VapC family toxin [Microcystis sp.]|jgi:predicted nucleic acid-binding protein|uniref:type II toxin-antitoxin system VapC family toxin n=1 Tax=unclassified Microcystis TaxID=2643300 RepID=UPI0022C09A40|nr:type II toxin-antitoxin system VapC family toxin [Microcystis sp. LE19-195.1E]MCZ8249138.1 type II toxin-antitoxin system VapC family toxin [Microcystis sp. LE19-195.1E]